jgi:hypothetical protein
LAKISARGHIYHIFVDLERMMGFGMQLWARKKKKKKEARIFTENDSLKASNDFLV